MPAALIRLHSSPDKLCRMSKKDWIILLIMAVVYTVMAYVNLGSTEVPKTQFDLKQQNQQMVKYDTDIHAQVQVLGNTCTGLMSTLTDFEKRQKEDMSKALALVDQSSEKHKSLLREIEALQQCNRTLVENYASLKSKMREIESYAPLLQELALIQKSSGLPALEHQDKSVGFLKFSERDKGGGVKNLPVEIARIVSDSQGRFRMEVEHKIRMQSHEIKNLRDEMNQQFSDLLRDLEERKE